MNQTTFINSQIIIDQRSRCKVDIKSCLPCTCPYLQKGKKVKNTCRHISQLCLPISNDQIIAYCYLKLHSHKTRLNIFRTSLMPMQKASKFLKKQKKQPSIFRLLNSNQKLKQMKVIRTFKNGFLTNLLKEKMRNAMLMEVLCPRTSYTYVYVSGMYIPPNETFSKERKFYFCALPTCTIKKPYMSNMTVPP